jgi:hypothetical protein
MKPFKINVLHIAMGALAVASIVAGCNGSGSGAGVSALRQAPTRSFIQSIASTNL